MAGPTLAFGKHLSGEILHITEATPGGDCHCICPQCDLPLVAKKGHMTPHFAHHPDGGGGTEGCGTTGQMTALHTFARDLFLSGDTFGFRQQRETAIVRLIPRRSD